MTRDYKIDYLAFAPHPDDAEIFCGGLLAKMTAAGHRVGIVDMCRGELSSRGDLRSRARETENASEILDLALRENLQLPDGAIGGYGAEKSEHFSRAQLIRTVSAIRRLKPEIILAPYWQSRHPDHRSASELIARAVFFSAVEKFECTSGEQRHTPLQVLYYQMRFEFRPSFIVNTSDFFETKMKSVRCYSSQVGSTAELLNGQSETLLSSPLSLGSIEARDAYYGSMIGAERGEPYLVRNIIGLSDPLEHFRKNPNNGSFIFPGDA